MKRLCAVLLFIILIGGFSACAPRTMTEGTEVSSAEQPADNQGTVVGAYTFEARGVEERHAPSLLLREDGTFCFTVNLLTDMGKIDGSYTTDEVSVTLTVEAVDFEGFQGDDVKTIRFDISSEEGLLYRGTDAGEDEPLGMTNPYDIFRKQK